MTTTHITYNGKNAVLAEFTKAQVKWWNTELLKLYWNYKNVESREEGEKQIRIFWN